MLSKILSGSTVGIDAFVIEVETNVDSGLPAFAMVGLPDNAVKESRERVLTALKNSGYALPPKRITVNLAPADIRKEGTGFDLPIALGLLAGLGFIPIEVFENCLILGELALDGSIRSLPGILPIAIMTRRKKISTLIVPAENAKEAYIATLQSETKLDVFGVSTLNEVVEILTKRIAKPYWIEADKLFHPTQIYTNDFSEIKGQQDAKKALEIAAAGGHNVIMIGSPGSGKTMIAKALPSILPPMTFEEALESTKIYSVAGLLTKGQSILYERPFRSPHHTASNVALIGGGANAKPGEVSLSHNGVLFLDELPEFNRQTLEALRQPLEDREVMISRASISVRYPASFMLIAAMNPSPSGSARDEQGNLSVSSSQIQRYLSKISGPLLDRIDIHIEVPKVTEEDLITKKKPAESSEKIRERVIRARDVQQRRYKQHSTEQSPIFCNAQMNTAMLRTYCSLDAESENKLLESMKRLQLSARAYSRILKVSRTIADLENTDNIQFKHLVQAIGYRSLDREYWNY